MKEILLSFLVLVLVGCGSEEKKEEKKEISTPSIQISSSDEIKEEKKAKFTNYDIKGNQIIDIAPTGEGNTITKQITAIAMIRNPYEYINVKFLEKRLSHNFIVKCSACHNDYANGIIGPSLLSKSKDEIRDMVSSYKNKSKVNVLMRDLVAKMPDDEIEALAQEISDFNAELRKDKK